MTALPLLLAASLAAAPAPDATPPAREAGARLRTLSFNVAGIPVIHPFADRRMAAIAERLRGSDYDLVALQEVWFGRHASRLIEDAGFPHHVRPPADSVLSDGLLILSRHPVLETARHVFAARPRNASFDGEAVSRKGILFARVKTPLGLLDVYDTHLIANYPVADYEILRLLQAFELADYVLSRSAGRAVLLMGDLNIGSEEPGYAILRDLLDLRDACVTRGRAACQGTNARETQRIDYVWVPAGGAGDDLGGATAFREKLALGPARIAYSDHRAVEARLGPRLTTLTHGWGAPRQREALARLEGLVERDRRNKHWGWQVDRVLRRIAELRAAPDASAAGRPSVARR